MKEIDQEKLDTAISLGNAVCGELGICCEQRGKVIHEIYKKLKELKPENNISVEKPINEAQVE